MKLLAQVPYNAGQSYDFYDDRVITTSFELLYQDIDGFGYSLTHQSNSLYFVPVSNSNSYIITFQSGNEKYFIKQGANNVALFKNDKQRDIDLIFSEVVNCINAFIAPQLYTRILSVYDEEKLITLDKLSVGEDFLSIKSWFFTKKLAFEDYGQTYTSGGWVFVKDTNGKIFFTCSLGNVDAPLIGPIIDEIILGK